MDEIAIDWVAVLYTFAIAMIVTVLCSVLPAVRAATGSAGRPLTDQTRTQVSSRHSLQWVLVGAQIAMSVVLLAGAGLLVRSLQELARVDLGFAPERILTFRVSGDFAETINYDRLIARIDDTIDAMRALPGVEAAATTSFPPGVPSERAQTFTLIEAKGDTTRELIAERRNISPEYFATMSIPVLDGELCSRQRRDGPRLVVINQAFRARYLSDWPSPIGLHLAASSNLSQAARIVAVSGDARDHGIDSQPVPTVYNCNSTPNPTPVFLVRTQADLSSVAQTIRLAMRDRDPLRSVYDIAPLDERIGGAFVQNRLRTNVLSFFALAALALAAVGLYGTLTYVVNLRRREVGLRLALGARRGTIVRQYFTQGFAVIAIACGVGAGLALISTKLLEGMLFGVSRTDPSVMAAVVAIVMAVTISGALIPAVRASLIEPMRALRDE